MVMFMYKGVIIEESLIDATVISEFNVVSTEVGEVTELENTPWLDVWTMDTVLIPEDKIDDYAKRLSALIDTKHCADWYCDFKNDTYHYVIFANKVFKLNRKRKEDYQDMQNYAKKLGLPEYQLPNYNDLPLSLLMGFLIDAKLSTYANVSVEKTKNSRLGSCDYHYETELEGEKMIYHDTYFGGTKFMGEEVVYRGSDVPKWGMNYYGVTLDDSLSEDILDKVLRPALMQVGKDKSVLPLRGPKEFVSEGYLYTFSSEGDMASFTGTEKIYKDGVLIFELHCFGGMIE